QSLVLMHVPHTPVLSKQPLDASESVATSLELASELGMTSGAASTLASTVTSGPLEHATSTSVAKRFTSSVYTPARVDEVMNTLDPADRTPGDAAGVAIRLSNGREGFDPPAGREGY